MHPWEHAILRDMDSAYVSEKNSEYSDYRIRMADQAATAKQKGR